MARSTTYGLLAIIFILVAGCIWYFAASSSSTEMTLSQAMAVAKQSECTQKGSLGEKGTYNATSQTWWIDFTPSAQYTQNGCNPACVVSASSTAEINWRCTGAVVPASLDDLIELTSPLPGATIQSPLIVTGKARGNWYFEASFPVKILDANGKVLAQKPAQAQSDWMTTDYVPFSVTLDFTSTTDTGTLVLHNDNPSGMPDNDKELDIPISFSKKTTGTTFSVDGNVTRNNPGQKPNVWYLIYEKPGAPGLSVELDLNSAQNPDSELTQGERVHVEGTLHGSVVTVRTISQVSPTETGTHIKLYYYNPALDQGPGGAQCSSKGLVAVERVIPKTTTPLKDAIQLLLRGELSDQERSKGITTEFPLPGVTLSSATISNGLATLTFADPQNKTSGGSCRVAVLWTQIAATAKQFPTVQSVRFLPADIFQP